MKYLNYLFIIFLCINFQNLQAQTTGKESEKKTQLSQNGFKPKLKKGSKEWLQEKRKGNVIFASERNYQGQYKVRASGVNDHNSLGFYPKSIFISKSSKYVIMKLGLGQGNETSVTLRKDIANLGEYISNLDLYPPAPGNPYEGNIKSFTIMQN